MSILKFYMRITKIILNLRIQYENHENLESVWISNENHENYENRRITLDNHENQEKLTIK